MSGSPLSKGSILELDTGGDSLITGIFVTKNMVLTVDIVPYSCLICAKAQSSKPTCLISYSIFRLLNCRVGGRSN